ncbi:hypothetical protein, partial [Paenibacillus taichungensis]|uniref:hypothetical protein n=1 Tax=Paenibacillus taichungensis TaxID=484184 RepID=UPI0039E9F53B
LPLWYFFRALFGSLKRYTFETREVYSISENGDHDHMVSCYKVVFLDSEMVPIASYIFSKKDGGTIKEYHR